MWTKFWEHINFFGQRPLFINVDVGKTGMNIKRSQDLKIWAHYIPVSWIHLLTQLLGHWAYFEQLINHSKYNMYGKNPCFFLVYPLQKEGAK